MSRYTAASSAYLCSLHFAVPQAYDLRARAPSGAHQHKKKAEPSDGPRLESRMNNQSYDRAVLGRGAVTATLGLFIF